MTLKQKQNSLLGQFEECYASEDYGLALEHICRLVELNPDDHWYWTRLCSVSYELKRYDDALQASEIAMGLDSKCPLVLWDYASVLKILDRESEASEIYKELLQRGEESIAYDQCGEGIRWARSLLNDCRLRLGELLLNRGEYKEAYRHISDHLKHRRRGQYSCATKKSAESTLDNIINEMNRLRISTK